MLSQIRTLVSAMPAVTPQVTVTPATSPLYGSQTFGQVTPDFLRYPIPVGGSSTPTAPSVGQSTAQLLADATAAKKLQLADQLAQDAFGLIAGRTPSMSDRLRAQFEMEEASQIRSQVTGGLNYKDAPTLVNDALNPFADVLGAPAAIDPSNLSGGSGSISPLAAAVVFADAREETAFYEALNSPNDPAALSDAITRMKAASEEFHSIENDLLHV